MTRIVDEPVERHEHVEVETAAEPEAPHDHMVVETAAIQPKRVLYDGPVYEERVVHDVGSEERQMLNKASQFIWLVAGLVELAIALRVFLKLIAANPNSAFASLVYSGTNILLWPFLGLTATPTAGNMVLEISSLIAMVVYGVAFYVLIRLLWILFERPRSRTISTYERR